MNIPSTIKFVNDKLKNALRELNSGKKDEKQLYGFLVRALKDIESNAFCGIQIPKKLIPKEYVEKYNIYNLWKYNLPDAWRLIYSIESKQVTVLAIVLEWMNHKDYEKRFRY